MGMPWGDAVKGDVARRLGAREDSGDGVGGRRFRGDGTLRCMLGLGGMKPDPSGVRFGGSGDDWESWESWRCGV